MAAVALPAGLPASASADSGQPGCGLAGPYKHVIYVQFDNLHLSRDNPNVASDLEQMPNLLNFLKGNGTVFQKHYTVLISHTAGGITSSLTGLYPDRMGITVSNSYDYYNRATGIPTYTSAFKYWTAPVAAGVDNLPNMVNGDSGKPATTPAPWVSYTRAGCDVGNVSVANTVLENANAVIGKGTTLAAATTAGTSNIKVASVSRFASGQTIDVDGEFVGLSSVGTAGATGTGLTLASPLTSAHASGAQVIPVDRTGDLTTIFGAGSPEWQEGAASQTAPYGSKLAAQAAADFVGIAVHCAKDQSSICARSTGAHSDPLPDEPGGYNGYQALFGAKYVDGAIGGSPAVSDINGDPITDPSGNPGFPGFDAMSPARSLGYVAAMQEAGVPVTFAYISDAHDDHAGGGAYGPGEKGYVDQLKSYNDAFGKFFSRLAGDGINQSNTLFVFTADENDHFAGQQATGCDGVSTYCQYNTPSPAGKPLHGVYDLTNGGTSNSPTQWPPSGTNGPLVGEAGYNMNWLLGNKIDNTGYDISFDSAPSFYIDGQPQAEDASGNIVVNQTLRDFEHAAANLKAFDPYLPSSFDQNGKPQATPVARYLVDEPTLQALHMINADPQRSMSFTMFSQPDYYFQTYSPCPGASQGCLNDAYAWIHGDYANEIGQTWLGVVGPGVKASGIDDQTWTDHTDIVPTMDALLGLSSDYAPDGRVITEALDRSAAKGSASQSFEQLGSVYKQLDAPYGAFSHALIVASTNGIESSDDSVYLDTERAIQSLTVQRNALVGQMRALLDGSANGHREQLIRDGQRLLSQASALAGLQSHQGGARDHARHGRHGRSRSRRGARYPQRS